MEPKFKGKQPKKGSACARTRMETLNNWQSSAQLHLKNFENELMEKEQPFPNKDEVESFIRSKIVNWTQNVAVKRKN